MSTRSICRFYDKEGKYLGGYWRHWDGYPSAHGKDIIEAVNTLMNMDEQITIKDLAKRMINGFELLRGDIDPISQEYPDSGQEYAYDVCETPEYQRKDQKYKFKIAMYIVRGDGRDKSSYFNMAIVDLKDHWDMLKAIKHREYDYGLKDEYKTMNPKLEGQIDAYYKKVKSRWPAESTTRCLGDTKEDEDTLMKDVRKEEGV